MDKRLLTVEELSEKLGVGPAWVYRRVEKGAKDPLPCVRLGGRTLRFDPDEIDAWIDAHRGQPSDEWAPSWAS